MNNIRKIIIGLLVVTGIFAASASFAGQPCFNCLSNDLETLTLKNRSVSNGSWVDPVSASPGDHIGFNIYYHNSGGATANNTVIKLVFPKTESSQIITRAYITSSNGPQVSDTGTINVANASVLTIQNHAYWYPNRNDTATIVPVTFTETSTEKTASVNIGNINSCWQFQGELVFEGELSGYITPTPTPTPVIPTVDLKVNGSDSTIYLQEPADYTLSWTSRDANTCSASNAWSGSKSLNGSQSVNNKPQGTYTYTITCANTSGNTVSDSVSVVVSANQIIPTVDLKVNGSDSTVYLNSPASYTLSWTSYNTQTCYASNAWNGSRSLNGAEGFSGVQNNTYTYTITCWNGSQSATDTVQVVVQGSSYTYLSVAKLVRNITQNTQFMNSVSANQGDLVEFSIDVYTNGSGISYGTYIKDILPGYLDFSEGSVRVDGYTGSDSLVSSGISLGDLYQGAHKRIIFSAYVMTGLPSGTNVLTNSSRAWGSNISEVSDTAEVVVTISGPNPNATLSIQKKVRDTADPNTPSGIYLEDVNTIPTRELEFMITVTGTGGTVSQGVMIHDTLPAGLVYVSNSTTVDGSTASDGIVSGGINIGAINPGQTKTIKFRATVRENTYFTTFVTKLINTAVSKGSNNTSEVSDTAQIWVSKTGRVLGATDIDTGVDLGLFSALMASGMSALGLSGFQVGRKAYWRGKIARMRKAA